METRSTTLPSAITRMASAAAAQNRVEAIERGSRG